MKKEYTLKILLFGAEANTHHMIQSLLNAIPDTTYILDASDDADTALNQLENNVYDLCLVDIVHDDDPSGWHFLERVQSLPTKLPIILLANEIDRTLDLAAIQLGATDFLVKPFLSAEKLDRAIQYGVERARFMSEINKRFDDLSAVEALKTDMIRIAAHDLRNPIATILLSVEMLLRVESKEAQEKHLQRIWDAAQRMQYITTEILSLEYIQELQKGMLATFDLREIVKNAYRQYEDICASKAINYRLEVTNKPIQVRGFVGQLQEAIRNFIENAIQYTPQGKHINVRLTDDEQWVSFTVEDEGIGVPEEEKKQLFKPFFRCSNAPAMHRDGMGLGLYLVKRIITRNNGELIFNSALNKGSVFGFRLPIDTLNEVM